jgi:DNA-binding transcriptional regulator GbsR (MarR family)
MLRSCAEDLSKEKDTDPVTKERILNMLEFIENTNSWYEQIREIPSETLTKIMKLGSKITKLVRG